MLTNTSKSLLFAISLFALLLSGLFISQVSADPDAPDLGILTIDHSVGENEPLIGGAVSFDITLGNAGSNPVTDKGYNITISNTLPISVTFTGATIDPTYIENQSDGTTLLIWDNISDLEVSEELSLSVSGSIDPSLTNNDTLTNTVVARFNHAPDNSLAWEEVTDTVTAPLQAVDIEVTPKQSTADEQATGAGEYDGNADWAYEYEITVKNNNVGSTDAVDAQVVLPAGVAYLGGVTISPNPNGSSTTPDFTLNEDGSLELVWDLGTLTTAHYTNPVVITFDTAIPYKFRTSSDILAAAGPFAGPMSGSVIPEDTVMSVTYEATATYLSEDAPDGTTSTTQDDSPVEVTAEYLTISKSGTPKTVGIGDTVVFDIDYYVSEYYTTTNVVITDILPDGMTYVSSSLFPSNIENNTPGTGQTRLTYDIPTPNTIPGASGTIQVTATVDSTYEAAPYAGEPVVSGDSLTNRANLANDWSDIITEGRSDTGLPDESKATVSTIPPSITKDVKDPETGNWGDSAYGFTGDTIYFKINFEQAANVDGKEVIVRDFLPRGMTFDASTDTYSSTGTFANSGTCNTNLTSPTVGTLNGLQYLEWKLCSVDQGSTWEAQFGATLGPTPDIQPGWIVGNFGKLSYQNTFADGYSQRDFATVDYVAPELVLTKTASPSTDLKGNDVVSYTITVENQGEATAYNLNLLDTVPEWLDFAASGGSATPSASSFTADAGAQAGTGGTLTWSQVASLAEGESLTFTYQATVVDGVPAGQNLVNIASVSYNSRSDNTGHAVTLSTDTNDNHTDDNTVYIKGLTVTKTFTPDPVTIGDFVTWTLTVNVPAGVHAYYPVVEENNLPQGFDYVANSTEVTNANLASSVDHPANPLDDGDRDLRWFIESIDNSGQVTDRQFTIEFVTLVTGVSGNNIGSEHYTDNCRNYNRTNTAYVGWYETSGGFNSTDQAEDSISTSYDFKSPSGTARIKLRQPCLTISKASQGDLVSANGAFYYQLTINNTGVKSAFDVEISDTLPISITYINTDPISVTGSPDFTGTNIGHVAGDTELSYTIDEIPAGESATIRYFVKVDPAISASLSLVNNATVDSYSSQPGTPSDSNGDTLNDERTYTGPSADKTVFTPGISISKASETPEEFTYGSTIVYTMTVPSSPINAVMYDVTVTDQIPAGLQVVSTSAGSVDGNLLTVTYDQIDVNQQEVIVVEATVPLTSTLVDGHEFVNVASVSTDQATAVSNQVTDKLVAPALVMDKYSDLFVVSQNDTISYTVVVKNVGLGTAYNITVTDILPSNQTFLNGEDGLWTIPALAGGAQESYSFSTTVVSATQGVGYTNRVFALGEDIEGNSIPADNSGRVPADTDLLDLGRATVYAGPLVCNTDIKNVAFEDLKNVGWSDWDYNDLIVKVQAELCFTPSARQVQAVNSCADVNIEAESAVLNGFSIVSDPTASGGQYIHIPDDPQNLVAADPNSATSATFTFSVAIPGKYKFAGIVEGTSVFADSFWFEVDGGTPIQWQVPRDSGLVTDDVADFANGIDPYTFELAAGEHTVTVYNREDGAKFDQLSMICQDNVEEFVPDSLATVTITYTAGARGATYNHQLKHNLDIEGGGQSYWRLFDSNDATLQSVRGGFGDDPDFTIIPDTYDALPPYYPEDWRAQTNSRVDQTEYTAGYWSILAVSLNDAGNNPQSGLQELPWDVYLPVKDTGEEVHLLVPGHLDNTQIVLDNFDANSPLVGQSLPLGFTFEEGWRWPHEFKGVWNAYPEFVDYIESGRTDSLTWYQSENAVSASIWETYFGGENIPFDIQAVEVNSRYQGSPIVADLDLDGNHEIILGDMLANKVTAFNGDKSAQWSSITGGGIRGSVAVGNLDADPELEVVAVAEDGMLYGWNHDGSELSGYPVQIIDGRLISTPALEDIDNDNELEIVISASNNRLYVREANGTAKWNASIGDVADTFGSQSLNSSPAVADLDNDNDFEIVVGSFDNCMYAFDHEGDQLWKFCTGDIIVSSPAVAEVGPDSAGKEVIFGSGDQYIYVLKADGSIYWRRETGWIIQASPLITDIDGDGFNDILIGSDDDNLHAYDFDGQELPGWPQATQGDILGRPTLADIDADGKDEILIGSGDTNVYAFETDGTPLGGDWPQEAEASVKGSAVVADIDGNSRPEVIVADFKGNLYVWRSETVIFLPMVVR